MSATFLPLIALSVLVGIDPATAATVADATAAMPNIVWFLTYVPSLIVNYVETPVAPPLHPPLHHGPNANDFVRSQLPARPRPPARPPICLPALSGANVVLAQYQPVSDDQDQMLGGSFPPLGGVTPMAKTKVRQRSVAVVLSLSP